MHPLKSASVNFVPTLPNMQEPIHLSRSLATVRPGYYIPARPSPDKAEIDALKEAASRLDSLLAQAGVSEEEMLTGFAHSGPGSDTLT